MTDLSAFGQLSNLTFHGPFAADHADRAAAELAGRRPATVVDYGCGWGELLLRVLERAPQARGVGVDTSGPDIERGRREAERRGLAGRVEFIEGAASDIADPADVVINCGAHQAFGTVLEALRALRARTAPGGVLLFGAEVWERTPSEQELAAMWEGTTLESCFHLPDLVDAAVKEGFRPLRIEMATRAEWDEFESGYAAGPEEWLLAHPDDPEADRVRVQLDEHRSMWLRAYREVLGLAYLTLGVPSS